MNKKIKAFSIFFIAIVLFNNSVFASGVTTEISNAGTRIINAVLWIGYAVALGMVIFIGIKYILGAADAKANMKDAVVKWVIGAVIVFMATTIVGAVLNVIGVDASADTKKAATSIVDALD